MNDNKYYNNVFAYRKYDKYFFYLPCCKEMTNSFLAIVNVLIAHDLCVFFNDIDHLNSSLF